ncbi:biotin/lipoate A/B protein ligase family protein [Paenibacillus septentrionalis]|uniref:Biotin/lipoate A/B protein ligase family protein n=1 Tax=Paenibacillus septentrionalis TaxID=429342 RepID=A0ABW1VAS1_9BACL
MGQNIASWASGMSILDRSDQYESYDPLHAFARDELLCKQAASSQATICHIWLHPNAFVLGQRDYRLPLAKQAMEWLRTNNFLPVIRHSGGAAVPLDPGVVNLSLIFPIRETSFHHDFTMMVQLIQEALAFTGLSVDVGEINGAYCPGDFDLSINGKKFCGIAQRRQLRAFSVQAFINAETSHYNRASLVRQFYERATAGAKATSYPKVTEHSTASLEELAHLGPQAAQTFITAIKDTLIANGAQLSNMQQPSNEDVHELAALLKQRYES